VKLDYFLLVPFQPPLLYLSLYIFFFFTRSSQSLFSLSSHQKLQRLLLFSIVFIDPALPQTHPFSTHHLESRKKNKIESLFTHSFSPQHNFIPPQKTYFSNHPQTVHLSPQLSSDNFQPQLCNLIHVDSNLTLCKIKNATHALSNASPRGGIASPFS
jgi:hypothetical protein